jgi:glycosyltransferase involved in cell wall biosynthesis
MKASVIIPTFNRGYILAQAVNSVLEQTYSHFEIIVIDDGSTDDTAEVISKFNDSRLRFIRHSKNLGVAAARNSGLEAAQNELISFLDSDDLWDPNKLALEVSFLETRPEVDAVFTDLSLIHGERLVTSLTRTCPIFNRYLQSVGASFSCGAAVPSRTIYLCMLQEMPIKITATTFRRKSLPPDWRFQETWHSGEDWDFLLRFARDHVFGFIDRPLVIQRIMSDSTLGRYEKADALMLTKRFIREKRSLHGDREAIAAVRRGIAIHSRRLGHCYLDEHEVLDSAGTYLRGFLESGDLGLLLRAPTAFLPQRLRSAIRRNLQKSSA